MAGQGPAPKADGRRVRRNKQPETTTFYVDPVDQPPLPEVRDWPAETLEWWEAWGRNPLSSSFTDADWSFLMDTALLHAAVWGDGELKLLPELRLRVAKYGATPEDRARLRIQFAEADAKDRGSSGRSSKDAPSEDVVANASGSSARARYSRAHLRAVEESA